MKQFPKQPFLIILLITLFLLIIPFYSCTDKSPYVESNKQKDSTSNQSLNASDTLRSSHLTAVTISHKFYTTEFDTTLYFPILVKYWLTKSMFTCSHPIARTDDFKPDPDLSDYTNLESSYAGSGYDRGHNMDAYDNRCEEEAEHESFYYSNMCPQTPGLNRGQWKALEEHCRTLAKSYDSILIWCGSIAGDKNNKIGKITVPISCWKILYIKSLDSTAAFNMPNDSKLSGTYKNYDIALDSLQSLTHIKFTIR
jgi:endonuclease G